MRLLLTFMAMAVLVVSIGCDSKKEETVQPKPTGETANGSAEVAAPDAGDNSATTKTTKTQTVSLKLPGMT
jgi:hypothetical protein